MQETDGNGFPSRSIPLWLQLLLPGTQIFSYGLTVMLVTDELGPLITFSLSELNTYIGSFR